MLEELGSDAHVIFPIEAPRVAAEDLEATVDEPIEGLIADDQRALFNARVDPRTAAAVGRPLRLAVDPGAVPLLRSRDRVRRSGVPSAARVFRPPPASPSNPWGLDSPDSIVG